VCLPLLIFPCTIKSRSSLLAPAHPGGPGKRAVKRLWCDISIQWFSALGKSCVQLGIAEQLHAGKKIVFRQLILLHTQLWDMVLIPIALCRPQGFMNGLIMFPVVFVYSLLQYLSDCLSIDICLSVCLSFFLFIYWFHILVAFIANKGIYIVVR